MFGAKHGLILPYYRLGTQNADFTASIPNDPKLPQAGQAQKSGIINPMIELTIPGRGVTRLEHLVCDVNGTLALDGQLIDGVSRALNRLRDRLEVHLVTADTHGRQDIIDQQLGLRSVRLTPGQEAEQKAALVLQLNPERTVAIGQGENDTQMLKAAVIGLCVFSKEGLAVSALNSADVICPDILSALELLEKPLRLVATLRK